VDRGLPETPPHSIGSQGQGLLQPSQTVGTMMHWLLTLYEYGTPDFTIARDGITDSRAPASSEDSQVFTAAFTKSIAGRPKTTLFAFNPGTQPVAVNFWGVQDVNQARPFISPLNLLVPPKKWAQGVYPQLQFALGVKFGAPTVSPDGKHLQFTVETDRDVATLELQESQDLVSWTQTTFSPPPPGVPNSVNIDLDPQKPRVFYRFRLPR